MITLSATFFDGKSVKGQPVIIRAAADNGRILVVNENHKRIREASLDDIHISEHFQHAPRRLAFNNDESYCEIADHDTLDEILLALNYKSSLPSRFKGFRATLISLGITVAFLVVGYIVGLPWLSGVLATQVPLSIEKEIGASVLQRLDEDMLHPTNISHANQSRIVTAFNNLVPPQHTQYRYHILFRDGKDIGPNAFALPGGAIIITDDLVKLSQKSPELFNGLLGVLAHEAGHIEHRHGLQQAIQASAVSGIVAFTVGDVSSLIAAIPATMLNMQYSRDHEKAADQYAIDLLKANQLSPKPLASMLQALVEYYDEESAPVGGDLFSSHPVTQERIQMIYNQQ